MIGQSQYHSIQVIGRNDGYIDGQAWGSNVNDTVSRLHGLNTSQMSKLDGVMYGPDGNPLNPFISDSYLFQNSNAQNETNNFGLGGSAETAYKGL